MPKERDMPQKLIGEIRTAAVASVQDWAGARLLPPVLSLIEGGSGNLAMLAAHLIKAKYAPLAMRQ